MSQSINFKISSGRWRGKILKSPSIAGTRPTKGIVRSALFNILRARIKFQDYRFIDCFSGTGMVGFEAMSQGFNEVLFFDKNQECCSSIAKNIDILLANKIAKEFVGSIEYINPKLDSHEVLFSDPPYQDEKSLLNFISYVDQIMNNHNNIIVALETSSSKDLNWRKPLTVKDYGNSKLSIFWNL